LIFDAMIASDFLSAAPWENALQSLPPLDVLWIVSLAAEKEADSFSVMGKTEDWRVSDNSSWLPYKLVASDGEADDVPRHWSCNFFYKLICVSKPWFQNFLSSSPLAAFKSVIWLTSFNYHTLKHQICSLKLMIITRSELGGTHQQSTVTNRVFFSFFGYRNFSKIQQNSEQKIRSNLHLKTKLFQTFPNLFVKKMVRFWHQKKHWWPLPIHVQNKNVNIQHLYTFVCGCWWVMTTSHEGPRHVRNKRTDIRLHQRNY
jgi:hypothetical protein